MTTLGKIKTTIVNTFHNTEINVVGKFDQWGDIVLSKSQTRRVEKKLCGMGDCCCFGEHIRGEIEGCITFPHIRYDNEGEITLVGRQQNY